MHAESDTHLENEKKKWEEAVGSCFHPLAGGNNPAVFSLQQISDTYFALAQGFTYMNGGRPERVEADELKRTDLTSVPQALRWFVTPYGRHTPAALLHDALTARASKGDPRRLNKWKAADLTFRNALKDLGVPPIRRYLMWAAVSFGSRWRVGGIPKAGVVAWILALLAGTSTLVSGAINGEWLVVLAAALAPLVGALLWGRQYLAGVIASYGGVFVTAPTLVAMIGYGLYRVLEWVVINSSNERRQTYKTLPDTGF